ncbi:hypothetical protein NUW58_g947 [Xylaria curta]|uniref:Uncharacterized protein n=1 Tax=Xylaria curta TaxID=42375 RepID=A0ACC1PNB6_9PEZI|nr:hypothetical protein NUW58_g947 [Xylaria curta]
MPQQCYQLATELHFRSDFKFSIERRCPHVWDNFFTSNSENNNEYQHHPYFDHLAQGARLVLSRFADDQLRSFRWDLGTCVPSEILGSSGIITLRQSSRLRSLHLITDPLCPDDAEIHLSPFRQLRSLGWKAPSALNLKGLSIALRSNSMHLQELDLDLVDWISLRDGLDAIDGLDVDDDDGSDIDYEEDPDDKGDPYILKTILGINRRSPAPYFAGIRVLSLTQVPITTSLMPAINYNTLESLTLRLCPGAARFLDHVAEQMTTRHLKRLEFHSGGIGQLRDSSVIRRCIPAFTGFEELFVVEQGPECSIDLWDSAANHQATLKKFVYHQKALNLDEDSDYFEEFQDLQDLAILPLQIQALRDNSTQHNPFVRLDLECLGLSCAPGKLLKIILQPFKSKTSLKLLHLRQSRIDMYRYESLGLKKSVLDEGRMNDLGRYSEEGELGQAKALRGLRDPFHQFLTWVFSPNGLLSLQVVAFGDFAISDAYSRYNVIVCRDTNESTGFRILSPLNPEMKRILSEYRDVLGACPSESSIRMRLL